MTLDLPPRFSRLSLHLVRDVEIGYEDMPLLARPADVAEFLWRRLFSTLDREALSAVYLDNSGRPIGWHVAYVGGIDRCTAQSRGIVLPALLSNAVSVIMAHNHPSGSLEISPEDILFSYQVAAACTLLGLRLLDSLVLAEPLRHGEAPRWAQIDWPTKGKEPAARVRNAVAAGILESGYEAARSDPEAHLL